MAHKIENIKKNYEKILISSDFAFEVQKIIRDFNSLPLSKQKESRTFFQSIGQDLIERNINVPNYDLKQFNTKIKEFDRKKTSEKISYAELEDNFETILQKFLLNSEQTIQNLKNYFLLRLENDNSKNTEFIFLCDDNFIMHPLIEKIKEDNPKFNIKKYTISGFIKLIISNSGILDKKYLCILLLSPNINQSEKDISDLKSIFSKFTVIQLYKRSNSDFIIKYSNITEILDEIEVVTSKILNNREIPFEEEMIIKKFFSRYTQILDYKLLKAGFSGSKVIEIQPIKRSIPESGRFVIKYSPKTSERKIWKEAESFKGFIDEVNIPGYKHQYEETETHEAIRYSYASSDSKKESYSFAQILNDEKLKIDKYNTIEKLFNCEPFKAWSRMPAKEKKYVYSFYSIYIKEDKTLDVISKIMNKPIKEIKEGNFYKNYTQIKNIELECLQKICHGDLHTENFFSDGDQIYLIDFGFTKDSHHAVIDHTTLESSIKFKHIPRYITIEETLEIEKKFLSPDSFNGSFSLSFIRRPELKELFDLIIKIRDDSLQFIYDKDNHLDYFISLFMIAFRQIMYPDLNQLYAYKSAELLSEKIVNQI